MSRLHDILIEYLSLLKNFRVNKFLYKISAVGVDGCLLFLNVKVDGRSLFPNVEIDSIDVLLFSCRNLLMILHLFLK